MWRSACVVAAMAVVSACSGEDKSVQEVQGVCASAEDCAKGLVCAAGTCKVGLGGACEKSDQCAAPLLCEAGICKVPGGNDCTGDRPCIEGYVCEADLCKGSLSRGCGEALPCQLGLTCDAGFCKVARGGACSGAGECAGGSVCDDGICRARIGGSCERGEDCRSGAVCEEGTCLVPKNGACLEPAECARGLACRDGLCRVPIGGTCVATTDCVVGLVCDAASTCRAPKGGECAQTSDCRDGLVCDQGRCHVAVLGGCAEGDCATGLACYEGTCRAAAGAPCPTGFECGAGLACDAGHCRADQGRPCVAGACASGLVCETNVCVGSPGAPCAKEADCQAALTCDVDSCRLSVDMACSEDAECAAGLTCDAGACKVRALGPCSGNQCATGLACVEGQCRASAGAGCRRDEECAAGYACEAGHCRGRVGSPCQAGACGAGLVCEDARCVGDSGSPCAQTSDCAAGLACQNQQCRLPLNGACSPSSPCQLGLVCEGGACRAQLGGVCTAGACTTGLACEGGRCVGPAGNPCGVDADCAQGLACQGGLCKVSTNGTCSATSPCQSGLVCDNGRCKRDPGGTCSSTAECATGFACSGGVCARPAGGACGTGVPCAAGLTCEGGTCRGAGGSACTQNAECASLYLCLSNTCRLPASGTCTVNTDCQAGSTCLAGKCKAGLGGGCTVTAECAPNLACTTTDHTCRGLSGAGCAATTDCGAGLVCDRGACLAAAPALVPVRDLSNNGGDYVATSVTSENLGFDRDNVFEISSSPIAFGDFNGDGVKDLAIGARSSTVNSKTNAGKAYVVWGNRQRPLDPAQLDLTNPASITPRPTVFLGDTTSDFVGTSLAAGDFNGDGYDDLFLGVAGRDVTTTTSNNGEVFVFFGGPEVAAGNGCAAKPAFPTGDVVVSTALHGSVLRLTGDAGMFLGRNLATGDINGDGVADVAAVPGSWDANSTYDQRGGVYVFTGAQSCALVAPGKQIGMGSAKLIVRTRGTASGAGMGGTLAFANLNGDSSNGHPLDDLIIGCEMCTATVAAASRYNAVLVVKGRPSFSGLTLEVPSGSSLIASDYAGFDLTIFGSTTSREYEGLGAGDVTGDGFADLFMTVTNGSMDEVWGLRGRADLFTAPPTGSPFFTVASLDASTAPANHYWKLTSSTSGSRLGRRLAVGDLDHDGTGDLVVTEPTSSSDGTIYAFWGGRLPFQSFAATVAQAAGADGFRIKGATSQSRLGISLGLGDFNADGYADIATTSTNTSSPGNKIHVILGGTRP